MPNNLIKRTENLSLAEINLQLSRELFTEPIELKPGANLSSFDLTAKVFPDLKELYFYKITEIAFEKDFPQKEAFENVISSLHSNAFNLVYLLSGDEKGVSIYLGIAKNLKSVSEGSNLNGFDVSHALVQSLQGNFMGTKTKKLKKEEIESEIIEKLKKLKRKSFIYGVPSINEEKAGEQNVFQGIDRLINSMKSETYQFLLVCEPVSKEVIDHRLEEVYQYYNLIKLGAERDYSENRTVGTNKSETSGTSYSRGKNSGGGTTKTRGSSSGDSYSGTSNSTAHQVSHGKSESHSENRGETEGSSNSEAKTVNMKIVEKKLLEQIQYIDEELLPRLKLGRSKGLFKTAIYALSKDIATLEKLEGNIRSIFQGDKSTFSTLTEVNLFNSKEANQDKLAENNSAIIPYFQVFSTRAEADPQSYLLMGVENNGRECELGTYLTAREISLLGGLPQNEVPGILLNEAVDFGVNVPEEKDGFQLGNIVHRGSLLNNEVRINAGILNKHLFVTGVTGSGKTTTCQKILLESKLPYLVIEPAKTEYRQLYLQDKQLKIFTVGRNDLCPFRINPLELVRGENLSSHIDMLMATFQAVYPMEASMPYILKEAIINCYEKLGWDLESNENSFTDDPWSAAGVYWPTLSNVVAELTVVVNKKGFAAELKSNYIGSLVSRFTDLTIGTRGSIFDVPLSVDFEKIIHERVVIELDELKSEEDKVLLMGLMLARLSEVLKQAHKKNKNLRHITLIEEAHRLLSKTEPGERAKKLAVQTFTDMLAEVRKYGESLIIVDQIPEKLTPEVLKNTNTKIVHKIFAEDDKRAIGISIALDDKQKQYLSKLGVGEAVIYTEGWHKPVVVKIKSVEKKQSDEVDEQIIKAQGKLLISEEKELFFPCFAVYELNDQQIDFLLRKKNSLILQLMRQIYIDINMASAGIIQTIDSFAKYFKEDDKLYGALAKECFMKVKTHYVEGSSELKNAEQITWLTDYFKAARTGTFSVEPNSRECTFLDKFNENKSIRK